MSKLSALIIDDEPDIRELLSITLERMGLESFCAENIKEAKTLLKSNTFSVCLTDMKLPDGNGVDFVGFIQKNHPDLPTAVITAHGNMESAIQALKNGAFDFLTKPVDLNLLRGLITDALNVNKNKPQERDQTLIGESSEIHKIREMVEKLSRSQAPVYISGESGTGKELVARMIHELGPRSGNAFIPVNCGAIPQELMESEFFGHVKGSFTGAVSDKEGLFKAADGGTLFLDEVAELPQLFQVKLLRAIQEKRIRPVGSNNEIPVNVRILSATHKNLSSLVEQGTFRQDLFFRINVIELHVAPLRDRKKDIPLLIKHILVRLASQYGYENINISDDAIKFMKSYSYPGNIRELENILERAITLCEDNNIQRHDLDISEISGISPGTNEVDIDEGFSLDQHINQIEKEIILKALEKTRWNKTAAASLLGLSFRSLRYRLKKLDIETDD